MKYTCLDLKSANRIIRAYVKDAVDVDERTPIKAKIIPNGLEFYATTECQHCGATLVMPNWPIRVVLNSECRDVLQAPSWATETEYGYDGFEEMSEDHNGVTSCQACLESNPNISTCRGR